MDWGPFVHWVDWGIMGFGWIGDHMGFGWIGYLIDFGWIGVLWVLGGLGTLWVSANLTAAQAPLECPMMIVFSSTPNSSLMNGNQMELKYTCYQFLLALLFFRSRLKMD